MLSRFVLVMVCCSAFRLAGQAPAFEVASLKPSPPPPGDLYTANLGTVRHGELTMINVTFSDCLRFAYGITNDLQIAGPGWIKDKGVRFDIVAKASADAPADEIRMMLRTLLAERFQLTLHQELKENSYLALGIGKKGSKLKAAQEEPDASGNRNGLGQIRSSHMAMPLLATLLSRFLHETVIDMTGLKGFYEVNLQWRPEESGVVAKPADGSANPEPGSGASIFSAIQSELGLRLEARKGELDVIVVDRALRVPLEN